MDQQLIKRAAEDILNSKKTIAFTGAGISVESGIPDFRGAQGLKILKKGDGVIFIAALVFMDDEAFGEII